MKFKIGDKVVSLAPSTYGKVGVIKKFGDVASVCQVSFSKSTFPLTFNISQLVLEDEYFHYFKSDFRDRIEDRL